MTQPRRKGAILLEAWRGDRRQREAAAALEMDSSLYSKYESGAKIPGERAAERIRRVTRIPVDAWTLPARKHRTSA